MASCQGCQPKKEPVKAPTPTHLPKKTEVKPQEPKKNSGSSIKLSLKFESFADA
ncbi:hypothetical protein Syun_021476 [Stephania yunnanensis]|uniref:Uncharacterized protein n=1 Tax=Stephania yunnanensis TaxID=152371 RepID=A0AAP0IFN7_9MAGN